MELVGIEETRVVYLYQVHRSAGQLYIPEAAAKLIARYSFTKNPSLDDLSSTRAFVSFGVGKFADSQIQELRVYNDGIIVEARSNSKIIEAFIDDFVEWHSKEFGLMQTATSKPERYFESSLIVQSKKDISRVVSIPQQIVEALNRAIGKLPYQARPMSVAGFLMDCDVHLPGGRRKQDRFSLDRRQGVPFEENVFFSMSPLPTDDHLALLSLIEDLAP